MPPKSKRSFAAALANPKVRVFALAAILIGGYLWWHHRTSSAQTAADTLPVAANAPADQGGATAAPVDSSGAAAVDTAGTIPDQKLSDAIQNAIAMGYHQAIDALNAGGIDGGGGFGGDGGAGGTGASNPFGLGDTTGAGVKELGTTGGDGSPAAPGNRAIAGRGIFRPTSRPQSGRGGFGRPPQPRARAPRHRRGRRRMGFRPSYGWSGRLGGQERTGTTISGATVTTSSQRAGGGYYTPPGAPRAGSSILSPGGYAVTPQGASVLRSVIGTPWASSSQRQPTPV